MRMQLTTGLCAIYLAIALGGAARAADAPDWHALLQDAAPSAAEHLTAERTHQLKALSREIEQAAADAIFRGQEETPAEILATTRRLLAIKAQVDEALEETLALRTQLVALPEGQGRREAIRQFLQATTTLTDLSGRLRYLLRDAIDAAAYFVSRDRRQRLALIDLLIEYRSGIGAGVMSVLLEDPPEGSDVKPADDYVKGKVLQLIGISDESDLLPQVAGLIGEETTSPALIVLAAECVRRLGLPQPPHPRQDDSLPTPAITAGPLYARLAALDATPLSPNLKERRQHLLTWLDERSKRGVVGDHYRFFGHEIREGDWFLMRNPSPYNLFTDLSPGLFTHVGVVTSDVGDDGIRRFVLVDLPERGATIPVTNIDTYVLRTLNYVFVRHPNESAAQAMGDAARQMIGNPTQFDLNFRTDRVAAYRDGPLKGKTINTYCAGFLLICAQKTGLPREAFFPIIEYPAPGRTQENLKSLGLSIGEDFVSPTAALFSPKLQIAGRRRPMHDPSRRIKESIYDHFAHQMRTATLHQSPNAKQALREKLARISQGNAWLRLALARANGVSEKMDLLSAARAAAVVETLDEIANASAGEFQRANSAMIALPLAQLRRRNVPRARIEEIEQLRQQHEDLYARWNAGRITPHQMQSELVEHYANAGKRRLDERFFREP